MRFITYWPCTKAPYKFFEEPQFRNVTLKCFTEISSLEITEGYFEVVVSMFTNIMATVNRMIPPSTSKMLSICDGINLYLFLLV